MSTSPAQETRANVLDQDSDNKKLSWEDMSDDRWPSDYWRVGADLRPELWPELWTFLTEGGG